MLKFKLLHPEILQVLGSSGHSSKVLIADGNYPFGTKRGPNSRLVFLNVAPGMLQVTDMLKALLAAVPVEAAAVMQPARTGPYALKQDPPVFVEFTKLLDEAGSGVKLERIERFKFYDAASSPDVCLTIATGEERIYANLLLTIGVVR